MRMTSLPGNISAFNGSLRLSRREFGSGGIGGHPRFAAQHCRHRAGSRSTGEHVAAKDRAFDRYTGSDHHLSLAPDRLSKADKPSEHPDVAVMAPPS